MLTPVIIGFPKCGTIALHKYIGLHAKRWESAWDPKCLEEFFKPGEYKPIFILRDPVERVWSVYNFFKYPEKNVTLEQFLTTYSNEDKHRISFGMWDFSESSDYMKFIKPFLQFDPLVFKLEEIINSISLENPTKNKLELTPKDRSLIETFVTQRNIDNYKYICTSPWSDLEPFI